MSKRRMEKIWAPADKVLCEIGRFVLIRPRISGLLLITAVIITILSNNLWNGGNGENDTTAPVTANLSQNMMPLAIADDSDIQQSSPVALPLPGASNEQSTVGISEQSVVATPVASASNEAPTPAAVNPTAQTDWQTATVHKGDNLAKIFKRNRLSAADLVKISSLPEVKKAAHRLHPGQELRFQTNAQGQLQQLLFAVNNKSSLIISPSNGGFQVSSSSAVDKLTGPRTALAMAKPANPVTTAPQKASSPVKISLPSNKTDPGLNYVSGEIQHSLTKSAHKAGLSLKQSQQLAQIFEVKGITQKLKTGDEFNVLYSNASGKNKHGNILAAQLIHAGQRYQLIRFTSPDGHTDYYNPEGQSSQPGLVRAPLNYNHLSSGFSYRRFDPFLHVVHAHLGVDYAAPQGTPVKAAGDGVIASQAYRGGYGRAILIQHDAKYSTLYAHLSRFADLKTGSRVKQGEVIGYVGQSGFATGPHLHYEIHVNNVPNDPLRVALPGKQIPTAYRNQFLAQSRVLLAQLQSNHKIQLAENSTPTKKS